MERQMVRRTGLLVVAAVLLAGVADAQYVRPARMDETGWEALGAPSGCASGYVPYFDASLKLVCAPTVYAPTTDTTTVGTLAARNVTATALPASGSITVTPQGTTGATTYTYSLQACLADGTCNAAGAASSTTTGNATLSATDFNRLSWSAVAGAASYKVRRDVGGATQGVIWTGTSLTVDDTGLAGDGTGKPIADMTGALRGVNYKTDGTGNVASGYLSQNSLTTGTGNIASGYRSQFSLTTGSYNVASGYGSQYALTTGSYNVASGFQSQYSLTTGTGNVASGSQSGYSSGATPSTANAITTSNTTTFIGHQSGLGSPTQRTNATAIGANAYVNADNRVVLGNGSVVDVWAGSTGQARLVGTGIRLNTGVRPTCDASTRGLIWYVAGGAGAADTCEVCRKDNLDAYAWVSLF